MTIAAADVTIINVRGLHARASAKFCDVAMQYSSSITVTKDQRVVGGHSLMALLMLGAGIGSTITIKASGEDATEAVAALVTLVNHRFYEDA